MAFTIDKILGDARLLCTRLKDHDNSADSLIEQAQSLNTKVEAMQTYQEDLNELNAIARHRPRSNLIMGLVQESSQIRELQQENKELRLALEEHQSALELIMSKYREQVYKLIMVNKLDHKADSSGDAEEEISQKTEKICEMASVMQKAIQLDEQSSQMSEETVSRLSEENRTLRELLRMAYVNVPRPDTQDAGAQTEAAAAGTATAAEKGRGGDTGPSDDDEGDNEDVHMFGGMDESYTSTDNSFDNPMQRSVIEVLTDKGGNKTDSDTGGEQDENANSSNTSSDIDTDNSSVPSVIAAN